MIGAFVLSNRFTMYLTTMLVASINDRSFDCETKYRRKVFIVVVIAICVSKLNRFNNHHQLTRNRNLSNAFSHQRDEMVEENVVLFIVVENFIFSARKWGDC